MARRPKRERSAYFHSRNAARPAGCRARGNSAHKLLVFENAERMAGQRNSWIENNASYYRDDRRYLKFIIPEGARVLDLGCGTGSLLSALKPSRGVAVDFSPAMIAKAKATYPNLEFVLGDVGKSAHARFDRGRVQFHRFVRHNWFTRGTSRRHCADYTPSVPLRPGS